MDTRKKILDAATAFDYASRGNLARVVAVAGPYDGLLAAQVRRLGAIRQQYPDAALVVVLTEVAGPLLNLRARAELVAGLAQVDFVVVPDRGEWEKAATSLAPMAVFREQETQERERRELMERVRERYSQ